MAPSSRSPSAVSGRACRDLPRPPSISARCRARVAVTFDPAADAETGDRLELLGQAQREVASSGLGDDRIGERVLAALIEAGGEPQHLIGRFLVAPDDLAKSRPTLRQRAGLVDDQRVDRAQPLDRLGVAEQHAGLRRATGRHHDRHRRGQTERTGTGDDQHRHRVDHRDRSTTDQGRTRPRRRRWRARSASTASTNQKLTLSASRCIGARERCACATSCTICASTVSEPTLSARMTSAPLPLIVAPITFVAERLLDRDRFAGQHRLIDAGAALEHLAIDRHLLARTHAQTIADVHVGQRNVLFRAVRAAAAAPSSAPGRAAP